MAKNRSYRWRNLRIHGEPGKVDTRFSSAYADHRKFRAEMQRQKDQRAAKTARR